VIWGNATHAPDDAYDNTHTHGELIAFRSSMTDGSLKNLTAVDAETWILQHTPTSFQVRYFWNGSYLTLLKIFRKCLQAIIHLE
jgi:phospholipid:diacylglycerol acyltransferase